MKRRFAAASLLCLLGVFTIVDFSFGRTDDSDPVSRAEAWRQQAEKGDSSAMYNLSTCYAIGSGVEKNTTEAIKWLRKAAEQKNPWAVTDMEALTKLQAVRRAAKEGDAEAQFNLARCYIMGFRLGNGISVAIDGKKAVALMRQSAEQGYAQAQLGLGGFYVLGRYVERDPVEAEKWLRKAAEQGDASAVEALKELDSIIEKTNPQKAK